jgi:hypothetical protein
MIDERLVESHDGSIASLIKAAVSRGKPRPFGKSANRKAMAQ